MSSREEIIFGVYDKFSLHGFAPIRAMGFMDVELLNIYDFCSVKPRYDELLESKIEQGI